jgi:hypothetical protein
MTHKEKRLTTLKVLQHYQPKKPIFVAYFEIKFHT